MSDYYTYDQMLGAVKNAKRDYLILGNPDDGKYYKVQIKGEEGKMQLVIGEEAP
jgi:hypothetical protein